MLLAAPLLVDVDDGRPQLVQQAAVLVDGAREASLAVLLVACRGLALAQRHSPRLEAVKHQVSDLRAAGLAVDRHRTVEVVLSRAAQALPDIHVAGAD